VLGNRGFSRKDLQEKEVERDGLKSPVEWEEKASMEKNCLFIIKEGPEGDT